MTEQYQEGYTNQSVKARIKSFDKPGSVPLKGASRITSSESSGTSVSKNTNVSLSTISNSSFTLTADVDTPVTSTPIEELYQDEVPRISTTLVGPTSLFVRQVLWTPPSEVRSPVGKPQCRYGRYYHPLETTSQLWVVNILATAILFMIAILGSIGVSYGIWKYTAGEPILSKEVVTTSFFSKERAELTHLGSLLLLRNENNNDNSSFYPLCSQQAESVFCVLGIHEQFWMDLYNLEKITWTSVDVLVLQNIQMDPLWHEHNSSLVSNNDKEPAVIFVLNVSSTGMWIYKHNVAVDIRDGANFTFVVESPPQCSPWKRGLRWNKKTGNIPLNFNVTLYNTQKQEETVNSTFSISIDSQSIYVMPGQPTTRRNFIASHDGLLYWGLRSVLHNNNSLDWCR